MKLKWMVILGVVLLAGQAFAEEPLVLKTGTDKENYANGVTIARNLKQQAGVVNLDILIKGMMDELTGEKLLMAEDELKKTMTELQAGIERKKQQAAMNRGGMKAAVAGAAAAVPNGNTAARKDESQVQKDGKDGQITVRKAGTSVVERYEARRAIKNRAAEVRRRAIEQERRATARPQGAI
ncbi:MAG TPA: FKBP-type peptidyl-prolyl cis-trans isomerase N-terminal domain-containing protein [Nitrospirota bacterium]|nr:FKBP-type peptidyl-prolyl cis-trans isomerase N-terminal domain-containing protein [Nitrospirota bacterium]